MLSMNKSLFIMILSMFLMFILLCENSMYLITSIFFFSLIFFSFMFMSTLNFWLIFIFIMSFLVGLFLLFMYMVSFCNLNEFSYKGNNKSIMLIVIYFLLFYYNFFFANKWFKLSEMFFWIFSPHMEFILISLFIFFFLIMIIFNIMKMANKNMKTTL